ncbi:DEAD/DEAH box helicase family protein, partial [Mycobacterium ulcerans str. Harvey]
RELASQITATTATFGRGQWPAGDHDLRWVPQGRQVTALNSGVDIVVACSGRLEDLMKQRLISLDSIEITVIDEADHMADLGFLPGSPAFLRPPRAAAATAVLGDPGQRVDKLVNRFLHDAVLHSVDSSDSPVPQMVRHVFHVSARQPRRTWCTALPRVPPPNPVHAHQTSSAQACKQLTESGVPAVDLHGNLSQPARDRNLAAFSKGEARVLVATDIAAAACMSTASNWWCTSTHPPSTRLTCTGPAARRGPGTRVTS